MPPVGTPDPKQRREPSELARGIEDARMLPGTRLLHPPSTMQRHYLALQIVHGLARLMLEGDGRSLEPDAVGWGYAISKFVEKQKPGGTIALIYSDYALMKAITAGLKYQAPLLPNCAWMR